MARQEKDFLGKVEVPDNALYGIHSLRAQSNFPNKSAFNLEWYKALGVTKQAVYQVYKKFKSAVQQKYTSKKIPVNFIDDAVIEAMIDASIEVAEGEHFDHFIVPAIQGGAGTSINLNVNEIIANRALIILGDKVGNYSKIDPIEQANIFQSTNDVIPTSLKVAIIRLLNDLEGAINKLRFGVEALEKKHRDSLRVAYTQMQEAVPTSFGHLFSSYNDALSRDWWRVSKCFERIKVINLGGTAIGTGITVPRFYIMEVARELQSLTKLPLTRGENLIDATANLDSFVEVHAILKSHAVNLEKMVNDLRLLGADIVENKAVNLPKKQVGSSIMPSKVNPVIPEYVISLAHRVYSNDMLVSNLSAQGCLELNAYIPVIGHAILESLELLISANSSLEEHLIAGLTINKETSLEKLLKSPAITTALIPYIGYNKATELAVKMKEEEQDIYSANEILKFLEKGKLKEILEPSNLLKAGYTIDELTK
jgi:aspartate ammonia-lyase